MKKLTSVPAVRLSCRQLTFDENEAREKLRKTRLHLNAHINLAAALIAGRMDKGEKHMTLAEYETNRAAYVEYLLMCVRIGDWHGVSDAANDLRVLDAKFSVIDEGYKK